MSSAPFPDDMSSTPAKWCVICTPVWMTSDRAEQTCLTFFEVSGASAKCQQISLISLTFWLISLISLTFGKFLLGYWPCRWCADDTRVRFWARFHWQMMCGWCTCFQMMCGWHTHFRMTCGQCADDMQMMCRWHTSSASEISPQISLSCGPHVISCEISTPKIFPVKQQSNSSAKNINNFYVPNKIHANFQPIFIKVVFSESGDRIN